MFKQIAVYLLAIITVEAMTEIVIDAKIFFGVRNWFAREIDCQGLIFEKRLLHYIKSFIGKLLGCGYCFSVWVAAPLAFVVPGVIVPIWWADLIIKWLFIHRMSNVWHEGIKRWLERAPWVFVVQKTEMQVLEPEPQIVSNKKRKRKL